MQITTTFEMKSFHLRDYLSKFTNGYDSMIPDNPSDLTTDVILVIKVNRNATRRP